MTPCTLDASTSTSAAPAVSERRGAGIWTFTAMGPTSSFDVERLFLEALARVPEDPGGGDGLAPEGHPADHVDHAVGEPLGGDAAVGLGRTRRVVGMAVEVPHDVEAVTAGRALHVDMLLVTDDVAAGGTL